MSEKDWAEGRAEIVLHEQAHIAFGHSWDILFTDILTAFQWFNPTVWMLRADLRELHEYQADEQVLKQGIDAKQYQYLLVKKAVGTISYSVANSFNHSTLKNRIMMMTRKRSTKGALLKVLYLLPLLALCLTTTAKTVDVIEYVDDMPESIATNESAHSDLAGFAADQPDSLDIILTVPDDMLKLAEDFDKNPSKYRYPTQYPFDKHFALRIGYDYGNQEVRLTVADTTFTDLTKFAKFHKTIITPHGGPVRIPDWDTPMGVIDDVNMALDGYCRDYEKENPDGTYNRENTLFVAINGEGHLLLDPPGSLCNMTELKSQALHYIKSNGGIILIRYDRNTKYQDYVKVENALALTYDELRNEYAEEQYGKAFGKLNDIQKEEVCQQIPVKIYRYGKKK